MNSEQILNLIYISSFCFFSVITYQILLASRINEAFKQGKIWQIRVAYVLISLVTSYLISELLYKIGSIISGNFSF
jgi:uncharacterized membrane protein YwzB